MKTFDRKDVFSWSNAENAKEYVGKLGYFGDSLEDINKWVQKYPPDFLFQILGKDEKKRFMVEDPEVFIFKLFLPAIKVIEVGEPNKYRSFKTMEEFVKTVGDIGSIIIYRTKKEPSKEMRGMFTGYMWDSACRGWILGIGASLYRLENLFELAEYKYKNEWQPFGVEE